MTENEKAVVDPIGPGHLLNELYVGTAFVKGAGSYAGPVYIKMRGTRNTNCYHCYNTATGEIETLCGKTPVTPADTTCGFEIDSVSLTFKRKKIARKVSCTKTRKIDNRDCGDFFQV
jgi:hypothetical protein